MNGSAARPWIIMALIFLLGAVTGSLLTIGFGGRFAAGPAPGPQELSSLWMRHLTFRLHLSGAQVAQIEPIVTGAENNIQQAHREDVGHIFEIMQKANASIKPLLNSDQQAELAKMETERERVFDGHMPDGHMRGPGHWHGPFGGPDSNDHAPGGPPPSGAPASNPSQPRS
jgi:hypothetical protein